MRHVAPVRRELGVRTVFNLLGPLTNPAGARRQVVGVYDAALVEPFARVLRALGAEHALVVHGDGGLDELTPAGALHRSAGATPDGVARRDARPARPRHRALRSRASSPAATRPRTPRSPSAILGGRARRARATRSLLNAAAALVAAGRRADLADGLSPRAGAAIDDGARAHSATAAGVHRAADDGRGRDVSYLEDIGKLDARSRSQERRRDALAGGGAARDGPRRVIAEVKRRRRRRARSRPTPIPPTVARRYAEGGRGGDLGAHERARLRRQLRRPRRGARGGRRAAAVQGLLRRRLAGHRGARARRRRDPRDPRARRPTTSPRDLIQAAEDLEMEALVEVHDEGELERALHARRRRSSASTRATSTRSRSTASARPAALARCRAGLIRVGRVGHRDARPRRAPRCGRRRRAAGRHGADARPRAARHARAGRRDDASSRSAA